MGAPEKVADLLNDAQSAPDRSEVVLKALAGIKDLSSPETITGDLNAIGDYLFGVQGGVVGTRAAVDAIINTLKSYENADTWIEVGTHLLGLMEGPGQASYIEQCAVLYDLVATGYEQQESFEEAARMLTRIPLDSSQRRVSQEDRVRVWVRIVRNYLEVDDSTSAESYLNKTKNVIYEVEDKELNLHFKLSEARINDAKREFLGASTAYHNISYSPIIAEEERLHTLSMAIKCAILAPAGPNRSRVLGRLYKDERSSSLDEYSMLEKMFLNRLLAPAEVEMFAQGLLPHQLATTSDGSTVLAKAVVEHNLIGASRLYRNIEFENLAILLGLDKAKAEETTARMVEQGRLLARIDQIDSRVWFEGGEASGEKGSGRAEGSIGKEMRQWDSNVQSLAEEVENITNDLQNQFPDFVAQNLVV